MSTAAIVTIMSVILVMALFLIISILVDFNKNRHTEAYQKGAWLFTGATDTIYSLLFGKDEIEIARKFGIQTDEYFSNCRVAGIKPNLRRYIVNYVMAILIMVVAVVIAAVLYLAGADIIVSMLIGAILFVFAAALYGNEKSKAAKGAKKIKAQIVDEMPRFLDLLETALYIKMPIETAISMTAQSIPGILSEELLKSYEDTRSSEISWMRILEKIAKKYNVDCLNSFVQDVTTSSSKGVSVYDSIVRQNEHAKQSRMLAIEEKADKTKTTILFPVFIFKLIPIMATFLFPVMGMMSGSGF